MDGVSAHITVQPLLRGHKVRAHGSGAITDFVSAVRYVVTDDDATVTAGLVATPDLRSALRAIAFSSQHLRCVDWCIELCMHWDTRTWGAGDTPINQYQAGVNRITAVGLICQWWGKDRDALFLAGKVGAPEVESWLAFAHRSGIFLISHRSHLIRPEVWDVDAESLREFVPGPRIRTIEPDAAWFELWIFIGFDEEIGRIPFPSALLPYVAVKLVLVTRCHGDGEISNAYLVCSATGDGYVFGGCIVGVVVVLDNYVFELA